MGIRPRGGGQYTVSCSDGTQNKSSTIEITTEGQVETVVLSYVFYLFNNEDGLISSLSVNSRAEIVDADPKYINFKSGYYNTTGYLEPQFDFTGYRTFIIKARGATSGNTRQFGLWNQLPGYGDNGRRGLIASVYIPYAEAPSVYTLDISSLDGPYYIGAEYYNGSTYVYEMELID